MTAVITAQQSSPVELARSHELEVLLRRFRSHELANRAVPGASRIAADVASRLVPLVLGYLGTILVPFPLNVPAIAIFAVATVSMLGSWFHDSVHGSIPAPAIVAFALQRLGSSPVGFSPRWWAYKHVRLHHRYPGNPEFDPDIQFGAVGRVSRAQRWRPAHATQHLHMWLLLPFATLNMLKPAEPLLARRYANRYGLRIASRGWIFLADKYTGTALVWAPVFLLRPLVSAAGTFLVFHLIAGSLVSFITQVQHNTRLSDSGADYSRRWPLCEQLLRTSDVGTSTGVWWWLCGGVNFHVVHHLAPSLSFLELPAATQRLRSTLAQHGLGLPVHENMGAAVRSHAALIRELARPD